MPKLLSDDDLYKMLGAATPAEAKKAVAAIKRDQSLNQAGQGGRDEEKALLR